MKKIISFILIFMLFTFKVNAVELDISSKNAILYNLDTNEILYSKNENEKVYIASLTKVMTALTALDKIDDLNKQNILISDDFKGINEANLVTAGFTVGEVVTYKDLLYGLLLPSGADAAKALARLTYGDEFINKMNEKAKELDLTNTNFSTTIGLDDENNYSTVKDFSIIFKKALENKTFKEIITSQNYTSSDGKVKMHSTINSNAKKYNIDVSYILGGKTGTTTKAGLCLATIAKENNVNYMLITTGALYDKKLPHHILDAKVIYDYFINNYGNQMIVSKDKAFKKIKIKYGSQDSLKLYPSKNVYLYLKNDYNKDDIKYVYNGDNEIKTPYKKGTKLGTLKIYYQDKLIDTQNIILSKDLKFDLFKFIKTNILIILFILILILILKKGLKILNHKAHS